ncbi:MAG: hypothetical protein JW810_04420 [Sedimentisphaerales bacterium]|nr:hypothetical protein [Sedimentisphaerales bacterium]
MKHARRFVLIVTALGVGLLPGCQTPDARSVIRPADYAGPVRIACIGDSITFGAGIPQRESQSYPAQLGALVGASWDVRNFGVSGATLLRQGDLPYWKQQAFADALAFRPDVVIIKLGTNDSKPQNWRYKDQFPSDYADLIDQFAQLPSRPRVFICLPVPVFQDRWGITESIVRQEIIPVIRQIAREKDVDMIDLYEALDGREDLFPDKIHPNAEGAGVMARIIYQVLTGQTASTNSAAGRVEIHGNLTAGYVYSVH